MIGRISLLCLLVGLEGGPTEVWERRVCSQGRWIGRLHVPHRTVLLGLSLLITVLSRPLDAQSLSASEAGPEPGARVRVNQKLIGSFVSWDENELVLSDTALVLADVNSLELSRGPKSNAGKGALIGGLIGAAAGATYGLVLCEGDCEAGSFAAAAFVGAVGAGAGALLGLVIGLAMPGEHWDKVTLAPVRVVYLNGKASILLSLQL